MAGRNLADALARLTSAAMLLNQIAEARGDAVLRGGKKTRDLGGDEAPWNSPGR